MKIFYIITITFSLVFAGRFGIGFSGGCEYEQGFQSLSAASLPGVFFGAEFHVQAEALPAFYLEPSISFLNHPEANQVTIGTGLRLTVQPKLGKFPLSPFFGAEGALEFFNPDLDLMEACRDQHLTEYFETSHPRPIACGYAGLSIFLSRGLSLDGQYRYLSLCREVGVPMAWAGMTFYLNW